MGVVAFERTFFADYKRYVFFYNPPRNQDTALSQTTSETHPCSLESHCLAVGNCEPSVEICIQGHFLMMNMTRVISGQKKGWTYQKKACFCENCTTFACGAQTSKPIAIIFYMGKPNSSTNMRTKFHHSTASASADICKLGF